jgi:hypothetical protein
MPFADDCETIVNVVGRNGETFVKPQNQFKIKG